MRTTIALLTVATGLIGSLLLVTPATASDLGTAGSGDVVYEQGRIDSVDLRNQYVIVDDSRYALAPEIRVLSSTRSPISLSSLQRGMRIAFALQARSGVGAQIITEIVVRSSK